MIRILLLLLAFAQPVSAQPLPTDPRLVTGTLDNGLAYIIRQHDNPPGRAAFYLHVSSGSLNETDRQRGLAHFLEHMAFNGSEHFPPGTVVPLFESLGLRFGADQNAFTSFDQTVYMLSLPDTRAETLDKSLTFLSDIATGLSLAPQEIENEREVILEERTARLGSIQRVTDYYLEHLAPGSLLGRRIPIGTEESIRAVARPDFLDYYTRWYTPSNITLIGVADMDPAALIERIKPAFARGPNLPRPQDHDPAVRPYDKNRAIVAADPELTSAEVGLDWILGAPRPVTSVPDYRDALVERIGLWIFNHRLERKVQQGGVAFDSARADVADLFGAARLAQIKVRGDKDKWRAMLADLATELQRARLHGFSEPEVADAKKDIQSGAERALETDATRPASQILSEIAAAIQNGDAITSAQQDLEIIKSLLPQITPAEAAARFNQDFDATRPLTFVLQIPSAADVPTMEQLVDAGAKALLVQPPGETAAPRAASLLEKIPEPAGISDVDEDPASHTWSAWLANGARLHYRFMDYRKDQVTFAITLAGGEIQETAENRGIASAAIIGWARPATSRLSSTQITEYMTGRKAGTRPAPGADAFTLLVEGSPAEIEAALQLGHLLLTDPIIETAAFDQWKDAQKRAIAARKISPQGVLQELLSETLYPPGDPRFHPLESEQIDRLTPDAAQQWLRHLCATAPIEIAIVGAIDRERALELARRYIGSLPDRERISATTLAALRNARPNPGPHETGRQVHTQTPQGIAMSGFRGASHKDLQDVRLLNIAAQILTTRATQDIREKRQLAYSPSVGSAPGTEYPALGFFAALSATAPANVPALLGAFDDLFAAFSTDGPTEDEMTTARKQFAARIEEQMREPGYWTQMLSTLDYRARTIASLLGAPEAYQSFTAEQVKAGFNRYYKPEARFRLSVTPAGQAPAAK